MYLYKTMIFKDTSKVIGLTAAEVTQNGADKSDFETNFKATAVPVDQIAIAETTFEIVKTYTQFKALIDGVLITWADVKYLGNGTYVLNLATENPL